MSEGILPLVFKFANFGVLVGVLYKYGSKPFKAFLQDRHTAVKEKIDEAQALLAKAEAMRAAYGERLARLDAEIEEFRKSAMDEAAREKQRIIDEAAQFAGRIREQAKLAYEQEIKDAMARVRGEIASRTIAAAEKNIRESFKKDDHDRLVDEFIEQVRRLP